MTLAKRLLFKCKVPDINPRYCLNEVAHYLDLTQMKKLKIPDGYQQVLYREDRTFLLQQGETYTVYDAGIGETGGGIHAGQSASGYHCFIS